MLHNSIAHCITVSHFFSILPFTLKYLCPLNQSECIFPRNSRVQMILCAMLLCSIAHSITCTWLFRGKMHSYWFNGIEILQGRWQHGEKVGYCYPSGLEKTLCKWDIYVPLVTKGLNLTYYKPNEFLAISKSTYLIWVQNWIFLKLNLIPLNNLSSQGLSIVKLNLCT